MKQLIGLCLGLGALLASQGCATVGSPFEFEGTQSISAGKTTKHEILAKYGKPFRVGYEDGEEKWTYGYYKYRLFGESDTKDLNVNFNAHGIVSRYSYSSSDPVEVERASTLKN